MSDPTIEAGKSAPETIGPKGAAQPGLLLLHPGVASEAIRTFLRPLWPDGNLAREPVGYRDISFAFFGLRAFCPSNREITIPDPDTVLPSKVGQWVDALAHQWDFAEVFAVRDLDFWAFLRDQMISWLHTRMVERRVVEQLTTTEGLSIVGVGLDTYQRALLRSLSESQPGRIHLETAFFDPPASPQEETLTERRVRKLFFLLQDAWHGVQLLFEDIFRRLPKVLFVSSASCWKRWDAPNNPQVRSDVHLHDVWRQGRKRSLRLYYRSDSYHPDVGAMTGGRLAPTYLRHFLFLLAQTSRGFWEVRRIQRQWRELRDKPGFRDSLVLDGLPIAELVLSWMDHATGSRLPSYVRSTRLESHFLKGVRPAVILLTHEQKQNRPLVAAACKLGIPTVAVQVRPLHQWDHAYLTSRPGVARSACMPDRLCVFSNETKKALVEQGGYDPSAVIVTGDPRDSARVRGEPLSQESVLRIRADWGVEVDQKVIALSCRPAQSSEILSWLSTVVKNRNDAFVLLYPAAELSGEKLLYRRLLSRHGLRWFHFDDRELHADWPAAVDLMVTTTWPELAEGIRCRTPVVLVSLGERPGFFGPDPGELVSRANSESELAAVVRNLLDRRIDRLSADERWQAYVQAVYGANRERCGAHIMDVVEGMLGGP